MNVGITLVFKEKNNQLISGVLKSSVLDVKTNNFKNEVNKLGNKIAKYYDYTFLGINDVFTVSGEAKQGEILGRTSYFDYDDITKSKELKNEFPKNETGTFLSSLIYFCSNKIGEKFTLTVLTLLELTNIDFEKQVEQIANEVKFKNKIIEISVDGIDDLNFIGVESLEKIDLKFNVFETLYSDFEDLEQLTGEIISEEELNNKLKDILI